ncbi:MAG TPA: hypothetical protein VFA81_03775 [Burkholderiales bacterium]|nr:hypothetical protein [Burkholderiales bacterium]
MNRTAVFSKTGKGLLEIKNRANRLSKDQYKVLNLVDGKSSLLDLAERAKVSEIEVRKILTALCESGYIKEFSNVVTEVGVHELPPTASYADDLDFTSVLPTPVKPSFYQSALTEQRQREEAERKASEAAARRARQETDRRAKEEAQRRAEAEEAARRIREEAERRAKLEQERQEQLAAELGARVRAEAKAKEEAERVAREAKEAAVQREQEERRQAELKAKEEAERRARIQAEARARLEAEKRKQEEERKRREEEERRRREEEERKRREEEERKRREEEERKRREEERKRREEEERKRREEEERKRREEEERKRREEEERKRREEEERKRREEEERKRREEERKRREEEERKRREEEERKRREEEERKRRAEEECKRREEEERKRREEEERKRRAEEERKRREEEECKRREEEERQRREEEERKRREEEERKRKHEEEERAQREEEAKRLQQELAERHRREHEELAKRIDEGRFTSLTRGEAVYDVGAVEDSADADLVPLPEVEAQDPEAEALLRVEAEVEKEFSAREDAIRSALAEQERRFRMEEEARAAMDRAEREARERADREARELALAAEHARREAEQKAREEAAQRAKDEKERKAREKAERKKQEEETRKKRERERREAEQRAREDDLARRRKEQEEADRRKYELERIQKEARRRSLGPAKLGAIAVGLLVAIAVAIIQFVPFSAYAPTLGKAASDVVGEPVRVGAVKASLFPAFHLRLESVVVGDLQDIRAAGVSVYMGIGALFGERKEIDRVVIDSPVIPEEALARLPVWLSRQGVAAGVYISKVELQSAKLELKGIELPSFNANVELDGKSIHAATLESNDGHFAVQLAQTDGGMLVQARGRNFRLPLGPALEFTDLEAKGALNSSELVVSEFLGSVYGGQGKATARVTWGESWAVDGNFEIERVDLEAAMKSLQVNIPSQGSLNAKGRFTLQAQSLNGLFSAPRLDASFVAHKGVLSGLDMVRALQSPSREGTAGGQTKYEELSGHFNLIGARYQYTDVRVAAGALSASGQAEVSRGDEVSGRAYIELRSSTRPIRGSFKISGTTKGMLLRQ